MSETTGRTVNLDQRSSLVLDGILESERTRTGYKVTVGAVVAKALDDLLEKIKKNGTDLHSVVGP